MLFQCGLKIRACILETSVRVKYRLGIRISLNSFIKGLKYQPVVIAAAYDIGNNRSVVQIQNDTKIEIVTNGIIVVQMNFEDLE